MAALPRALRADAGPVTRMTSGKETDRVRDAFEARRPRGGSDRSTLCPESEAAMDDELAQSFPASDPPSWTPAIARLAS